MIVVVQYEYLPERTEERLAARPAHREWEAGLKAEGVLVQGGPFEDGLGAMLIFDVTDDETLDGLLAADPYPKDTFVVASRRRWTTLFDFGR
ncbi:MAG TPA: YciI family protein [Propionibacteriaceae bacterium]|nr:YciI family protein [Propionibacteriaceae bacterium]